MRGPRLRLLVALLALAAFALTALDSSPRGDSPLDALRRGADTVFGPPQRALGAAVRRVGEVLPSLGGRDDSALRRENDQLRRRLLELEGLEDTGRQLRELLALKDAGTYTTVLARVVGYGAFQPFEHTITIDAGSRDGVREDQTVTAGVGLVGRTVRVGPDTAVVALLTDPTFSVGARVQASARSVGLARGDGRGLRFELVELGDGSALQVGDALVTSGSGTFVPGVPIGRVDAVQPRTAGVSRSATVLPFVDLGRLDLLQVVVEGPRGTPRVPIPPAPALPAPDPPG